MRAGESFGVSHCTEFARNDQRTFAFFWDLVGAGKADGDLGASASVLGPSAPGNPPSTSAAWQEAAYSL
jgi:hypothetical protein